MNSFTRIINNLCLQLLVLILPLCAVSQISIDGQDDEITIYQKWDRILRLRIQGKYDEAIREINIIIEEVTESRDIHGLRYALNQLIHTLVKKRDFDLARKKVREALETIPDLTADLYEFDPWLNETYDAERKKMFGSLIIKSPKGCHVYLNENDKGLTPLSLELVRSGTYILRATKSGYRELHKEILVEPNVPLEYDPLPIEPDRGIKWWISRVYPVIHIVGTVVLAFKIDPDDRGKQPLPLPPPPPTH